MNNNMYGKIIEQEFLVISTPVSKLFDNFSPCGLVFRALGPQQTLQ